MKTILYKTTPNGKAYVYDLSIKGNELISIVGLEGGKKQTYIKTVNEGKQGRTIEQQLELMYNSKLRELLRDGYSEDRNNTGKDSEGRIKPMLASSFDAKLIKYPCLVQPKYDGVRCLALWVDDHVELVSRNGKTYNIPHIIEFLTEHKDLLPLDGELYNSHMTFQEITSAVKKQSELTEQIEYVIYDTPIDGIFTTRYNTLEEKLSHIGWPLTLAPCEWCEDDIDLYAIHNKMKLTYEGSIIRNIDGVYENRRSKDLIKLKDFQDAEFEIIDVAEGSGRDSGTAILILKSDAGTFSARPTGTIGYRTELWRNRKDLIGKMATVKYQELYNGGIPRFPVVIGIRDYE